LCIPSFVEGVIRIMIATHAPCFARTLCNGAELTKVLFALGNRNYKAKNLARGSTSIDGHPSM
jgi:hypothetical protein